MKDRFSRDFRDLHGAGATIEGEAFIKGDWRDAPIRPPAMSFSEAVIRLSIGSLGLFWGLVLGIVLIGLLVLGGLFVSALFGA